MQFRLSTLFLSMVVVASSLALARSWGIVLAGYGLLFVWAVRAAVDRRPGGSLTLSVLLVLGFLMFCLVPAMPRAGPAARRAMCHNNLRQLSMALENYHQTHGCFPPPYLADKDGKPMHSWRVLILPYIEQWPLWKSYRFDEPWNGPNNRRLAMPLYVYRCPADGSGTPTTTSYVMVTGPGTASEEMVKNGHAQPNRILLAEVVDSGIEWMEPRDLTLEEARAGINPSGAKGISGLHMEGAHVVLAKGLSRTGRESVLLLDRAIPQADLEALLTGDLSDAEVETIVAGTRSRQASVSDHRMLVLLLRFGGWIASLAVLLAHGLIADARDRKRKPGKTPGTGVQTGTPPNPADSRPS